MRKMPAMGDHRDGVAPAAEHDATGTDVEVALILRVGVGACAVPMSVVAETMRPLPCTPVAGAPIYVRGMSLIRGEPHLVIDVRALVEGGEQSSNCQRFVTVRVAERHVALAVDAVVGVRRLKRGSLREFPPLLHDESVHPIAAIAVADAELLCVLRSAWVLPVDSLPAIVAGAAAG
jgi:purine-binding chemotaxis protein CheW